MAAQQTPSLSINGLQAAVQALQELDATLLDDVTTKLRVVAFSAYARILTRSPVDTGRYRGNWAPPDVSESGGIVRAVISNNVEYARPVTFGCPVGQKPWPRAGPRTLEYKGRIYAKGELPSDSHAQGGVIDETLETMVKDAVDDILSGLLTP